MNINEVKKWIINHATGNDMETIRLAMKSREEILANDIARGDRVRIEKKISEEDGDGIEKRLNEMDAESSPFEPTQSSVLEPLREVALKAMAEMESRNEVIRKLPEPTVSYAGFGAADLGSPEFNGVLHNPIYAGVPPFPAIVSDTELDQHDVVSDILSKIEQLVGCSEFLTEIHRLLYPHDNIRYEGRGVWVING